MKAAHITYPWELVDSVLAVLKGGGFCEDAWFRNACIITGYGQVGCRDNCGESLAWNADGEDEIELVRENHGRLVMSRD